MTPQPKNEIKDNRQSPKSLQKKRQENFFSGLFFQPSLEVGSPDDPFEQEAERVSQQVMHQYDIVSGISSLTSADGIQTKLIQPLLFTGQIRRRMQRRLQKTPFAQAKCAECEEEEALQPKRQTIQRSGNEALVDEDIENRIVSSQGGGQGMDAGTKAIMESSFGADFGGVRIHTDNKAVQMSQDLGAHAFTVGRDIYFNEGKYQPGTRAGVGLLSHELTHVVQQGEAVQTRMIHKQADEDELQELYCPVQELDDSMAIRGSSKKNAALFKKSFSAFKKENSNTLLTRSFLQKRSVGGIRLKDSSKVLRRCGGCNPSGGPTPTVNQKAQLKSGPTYTPNGTINASVLPDGRKTASFAMAAVFENDPTASILASCGQVRQYIKWSSASNKPNHAGFAGSGFVENTWYEDRDSADTRYGHRAGKYSAPMANDDEYINSAGVRDQANGPTYRGNDRPVDGSGAKTGFWYFRLDAIDTCNGNNVLGSATVNVKWG